MSYDMTCTWCETKVTHECRRWRDRDEDGNTAWREDLGGPPSTRTLSSMRSSSFSSGCLRGACLRPWSRP